VNVDNVPDYDNNAIVKKMLHLLNVPRRTCIHSLESRRIQKWYNTPSLY